MKKLILVILIILTVVFTVNIKEHEFKSEEISTENLIGIHVQRGDGNYTSSDTIPTGYTLNTTNSFCYTTDKNKPTKNISYDANTKTLSVPITEKGTKCELYFDSNS